MAAHGNVPVFVGSICRKFTFPCWRVSKWAHILGKWGKRGKSGDWDRSAGGASRASGASGASAALVLLGGIDAKDTEPDVHGHRSTYLSERPALEGPAAGTEDARRGTSRDVRVDPPDVTDRDASAHGELAPRSHVPRSHTPHSRTWEQLDDIDLPAEFRRPTPLQDVRRFSGGRAPGPHVGPPHAAGATCAQTRATVGKGGSIRARRTDQPTRERPQLPMATDSPPKPDKVLAAERRERACTKVRMGEVSRARQVLAAAELAPGTEDTFCALTNGERRPRAAQSPIPPEVLAHDPGDPVQLSAWAVAMALQRRSARAFRHAC